MIRAYETRGHHIADLDPLGIMHPDLSSAVRTRCCCIDFWRGSQWRFSQIPRELTLEHYGFTEADLERTVVVPPLAIFNPVGEETVVLWQPEKKEFLVLAVSGGDLTSACFSPCRQANRGCLWDS